MDWYAFSAPVPGAFEVDVGFAFVASVVGFVVAFAPAVLAARSMIDGHGVRGLISRVSLPEGFRREAGAQVK